MENELHEIKIVNGEVINNSISIGSSSSTLQSNEASQLEESKLSAKQNKFLNESSENALESEQKQSESLEQNRPGSTTKDINNEEKRYLKGVLSGDIVNVRNILENAESLGVNINCVDAWNRSALVIAVENENRDLLRLLLNSGLELNDAVWHAISEEYLDGVELILSEYERRYEKAKKSAQVCL